MLVLISISLFARGLYSLSAGDSRIGGIGLTVAGVFSALLAVRMISLREKLERERKRNEQLIKSLSREPKKTKSPMVTLGLLDNQPVLEKIKKLPEPAVASAQKEKVSSKPQIRSKPKVPKPPAPEPPEYLEPESPEFLYPEAPDDVDYGPEEPAVNEPDPFHPAPVQIPPAPDKPPVIINRTSSTAGGHTQETWKGERTWSPLEVDELLELYFEGDLLESIAIKLRIDKKDVVYKLTRLNFDELGDLEDVSEAPNYRKAWSEDDSKKLLEMNAAGISLSGMAKILGRTKLAIGWRLAEQRKLMSLSGG